MPRDAGFRFDQSNYFALQGRQCYDLVHIRNALLRVLESH